MPPSDCRPGGARGSPEPDELRAWVTEPLDDSGVPPTLRDSVPAHLAPEFASEREGSEEPVTLDDFPSVRDGFEAGCQLAGLGGAGTGRPAGPRPVRQLFSTYVTAGNQPEELELVLGVGCLAWTPRATTGPPAPADRPAAIQFDDDTGRLTVCP